MTFRPTHTVPATGISTWTAPDPQSPQAAPLSAALPVEVFDERGDWANVRCSNGFTTWVDRRQLVGGAAAAAATPLPAPAAAAAVVTSPAVIATPMPAPHAPSVAASPATAAAGRPMIGVTQFLTIAGSALVVISTLLGWYGAPGDGFSTTTGPVSNAFSIPLTFLFGTTVEGTFPNGSGLAVALPLIAIAAAGAATAFIPHSNVIRWVTATLAAVVPTAYANQIIHFAGASIGSIGTGPWWCAAGAVVMLVGNCKGGGAPRVHR